MVSLKQPDSKASRPCKLASSPADAIWEIETLAKLFGNVSLQASSATSAPVYI